MVEVNENVNFAERLIQLQSELQREKENATYEKKLRTNYHTKHCAAKKTWQTRNLNLRKEIARLQDEKKSAEVDMNLFERMLSEKDRELQQLQFKLNELQRLTAEKDQKIVELESKLEERESRLKQIQTDYNELLDLFINVKIQMERLLHSH